MHVPDERRKKLDYKSTAGIFVGYATTKQYRIYDPKTKRLHLSRDVVFRENSHYKLHVDNIQTGNLDARDHLTSEKQENDHYITFDQEPVATVGSPKQPLSGGKSAANSESDVQEVPVVAERSTIKKAKGKGSRMINEISDLLGASTPIDTGGRRTRTQNRTSTVSTATETNDEDQDPEVAAIINAYAIHKVDYNDGIQEPCSYSEAMKSPQADQWNQAMLEEIQAIQKQDVYEQLQVDSLPPDVKAIGSHWVYKIKRDLDGTIFRYKARVVARGDQQREGIDYGETYAPTARMGHIHLILALAAKNGWDINQMDVCTVFLRSDLHEDIYMRPPPGCSQAIESIWKLKRSLYGLKQSPYQWYHTLRQYLQSLSYTLSRLDGGFFMFYNKEKNTRLILSIYVDDILLIGTRSLIAQMKEEMCNRFEMHDLGKAATYLSLNIEQMPDKSILLHQAQYIDTVLRRFKMDEANSVSTPLDSKARLIKRKDDSEDPADEACDKEQYQSMLGSVMYLMTGTRPDIAFAVGVLSRFSHNPSNSHMKAMKRLLHYIKGTKDWKLRVGGASSELAVYADADYAGCKDDFKSTSGYVITYGGAIDWRSRKQKSVAQSTADAEYYAFGHACIRLLEIELLLKELNISSKSSPVIYGDNESCIKSLRNGIYRGTEGATHIGTKFFLTADLVREGRISVEYVPTSKMLADGFTKALPKPAHKSFCRSIGLIGNSLIEHGKEEERLLALGEC